MKALRSSLSSWDHPGGEGEMRALATGFATWEERWHNSTGHVTGTPVKFVCTPIDGLYSLRAWIGDLEVVLPDRKSCDLSGLPRHLRAMRRYWQWLSTSALARRGLLSHPDRRTRLWAIRHLLGPNRIASPALSNQQGTISPAIPSKR